MRKIEVKKNWPYKRVAMQGANVIFAGIYLVGPHISKELADRAIKEGYAVEIETPQDKPKVFSSKKGKPLSNEPESE